MLYEVTLRGYFDGTDQFDIYYNITASNEYEALNRGKDKWEAMLNSNVVYEYDDMNTYAVIIKE